VIGYVQGANRSLNKRALMTYVAQPFYVDPKRRLLGHVSGYQSVEIAKAFNRLGYIVDVVDWLDATFIPTQHYDVFFGMHYNFERLLPYLDKTTVKIYYGTGTYWAFEIAAEQQRVEALKKRRGVEIKLPIRLGPNNWVQIADAVIVIGNEFTASTYRPHNSRVFTIDNSARLTIPPDLEYKDFITARRNFLAFPSAGLLHKGIDLLLEVFADQKDLHLWVCGPLQAKAERDFVRVYRRELFHTPNIHPIGWIDIHSRQFRQLTNKCAFVIFPSCAEGMSGGVLDCMGQGLIPLVSRETGVDTDGFGVTFKECSIDVIRQVVTDMAKQPPDVLRRMAQEAFRQASTRYSLDSFSKNIERILRIILNEQ
jgi:glycosyltransferase involved in cell wall biosynthesis